MLEDFGCIGKQRKRDRKRKKVQETIYIYILESSAALRAALILLRRLRRRSCCSCRQCRLAWLCHLAWKTGTNPEKPRNPCRTDPKAVAQKACKWNQQLPENSYTCANHKKRYQKLGNTNSFERFAGDHMSARRSSNGAGRTPH